MSRFTFLILIAAVISSWSTQAQEISGTGTDRVFERSYRMDLSGHDTIHFKDMGSEMELSVTEGTELVIFQEIPVGDRSRSEAMDFGLEFGLELSVNADRAEVESDGEPRGTSYEILIPEGIHVDFGTEWGTIEASGLTNDLTIRHGGGEIELDNIGGDVSIRSEVGVIEVTDVGGHVEVQSDGGAVSIARVGESVTIATGGGGLEVEDVEGDVSAITAGGNVDISVIGGSVRAVTSAGNMEVSEVAGDATLTNGGGSIDADEIGGDLAATTTGGDIDADGVKGEIRVETLAGDVDVSGARNSLRILSEVGDIDIEIEDADFLTDGRIEVDLGYGDIDLLLPRNTDADVVANVQESGGIDISNEGWDVEVLRARGRNDHIQSRRAELRIGDGGGMIQIRLLSGEITIDNE